LVSDWSSDVCSSDLFHLMRAIGLGQAGANEGAAAALRFEEAEQFQFVVRLLHGERGNDELFAEVAMRGQLLAGLETAAGDGFGDLPHDLAVDGELVGGMDE